MSHRLISISILIALVVPSFALASGDINYGVVDATLLGTPEQDHQLIWDDFVAIAGKSFINDHVNQFRIIADENDDYLAYVQQDGWDLSKWAVAVDLDQLAELPRYNYLETLVHEYSHILTLNEDEFDIDEYLFEGDEDYNEQAREACDSYFNNEGCAKTGSAMDLFYQQFWMDIEDEHALINPDDYSELDAFRKAYPNTFITWYAPSNAEEDLAETFAHFVLDEPEEYTGVVQDKLEFFYDIDGYTEIRERIRQLFDLETDDELTPEQQAELEDLIDRLAGTILLFTDHHGEAWYIDPITRARYYLKDGPTAYEFLRTFGLGITNADLANLPKETDAVGGGELAERLAGRIVLQVEERGEAYYINPIDLRAYYLKDGDAAYQIMRELSLGTLKNWVDTIPVGS